MDIEANPARPPRAKYARALAKMQSRQYNSWGDRLSTEMFVVGTHMFEACSVREYGDHRPVFSGVVIAVIALAYGAMAGAFLTNSQGSGPTAFHPYFTDNVSFSSQFLLQWGGMYGPQALDQPYRILTYAFSHQNVVHFISNALVFGLVSFSLEHR